MATQVIDPEKAKKAPQKPQKSTIFASQKSIFSKISIFHLRLTDVLKRLSECLKPTKQVILGGVGQMSRGQKFVFRVGIENFQNRPK